MTAAELRAFAEQAPSERSLVVAFEVRSDLMARGIPVDNALAEVGTRVEARASDTQLRAFGLELGGQARAGAELAGGLGLGGAGSETASVTGVVRGNLRNDGRTESTPRLVGAGSALPPFPLGYGRRPNPMPFDIMDGCFGNEYGAWLATGSIRTVARPSSQE